MPTALCATRVPKASLERRPSVRRQRRVMSTVCCNTWSECLQPRYLCPLQGRVGDISSQRCAWQCPKPPRVAPLHHAGRKCRVAAAQCSTLLVRESSWTTRPSPREKTDPGGQPASDHPAGAETPSQSLQVSPGSALGKSPSGARPLHAAHCLAPRTKHNGDSELTRGSRRPPGGMFGDGWVHVEECQKKLRQGPSNDDPTRHRELRKHANPAPRYTNVDAPHRPRRPPPATRPTTCGASRQRRNHCAMVAAAAGLTRCLILRRAIGQRGLVCARSGGGVSKRITSNTRRVKTPKSKGALA